MIKIFKTEQIKDLDRLTVTNEGITSFDLMKRAVSVLTDAILAELDRDKHIVVFAGPGNNGGDALLLSKHLSLVGLNVIVYLVSESGRLSADCKSAKEELEKYCQINLLNKLDDHLNLSASDVVIDGLFGSGLSRKISGLYADVINNINESSAYVISIDIPSGLFGENNNFIKDSSCIRANRTFTFQQLKLSMLMPETESYLGKISVLDIGLSECAIQSLNTDFFLTDYSDCYLKSRKKFSHKGTFGHALLIAGKYGMAGAALLASKACMRSGVGLLTTHIPQRIYSILQCGIPEAIIDLDDNESCFSGISVQINKYSAVGIGPGLGKDKLTAIALHKLLDDVSKPIVVDADAINIIADSKELIERLPENSILTPHPKEFDRLFGDSDSMYDRIIKQRALSIQYGLIIVLKNAYTSISLPNGEIHFNTTGNSGMSTAGSGDVLTGIILSLLAQGYTPEQAAVTGVYLHGLAGDFAIKGESKESLIASDIIANLGSAFSHLQSNYNK